MKSKIISIILIVLLLVFVNSCAPGSEASTEGNPGGFFMGIWHGWIAPVSLIIGFFNENIRIYETYNTGWWYDFGYYIAIIGGFGGFSILRRKTKHRDWD